MVFTCSVCQKHFTQRNNMLRHIRTVHQKATVPESLQCSLCHKVFDRLYNLKRHTNTVHTSKKPFSCPLCDASFSRSDYLTNHLKSHTLKRKVPHPQEVAGPSKRRRLEEEDPQEVAGPSKRREEEEEEDVNELRQRHWDAIRTHHTRGRHQQIYTFHWENQAP